MRSLIQKIFILALLLPTLLYAQDLDRSQISKNTEKAKKERKKRMKSERPTGIIINLGYAGFSDDDSYFSDNITYSSQWGEDMEEWSLRNGSQIDERESYETSEINIRLHYLLKNINLGFFISPIVINTTQYQIVSEINTFDEELENVYYPYGPGYTFLVENNTFMETYEEGGKTQLGSIEFGASTTILFNRVTISAGTALSISKISPVKTLEIGAMLHLTDKINFEYRYSSLKAKQEFNFIDPKFHMLSLGYRISK